MITFRAVGFKQAARQLRAIPQNQTKHINQAITKCLIQTQRDVIPETPIDSGFLRNNILFDQPRKMKGRLEARADYSLGVHEGYHTDTGPYRYKGRVYFAREGQATKAGPNPYFERGIRRAEPKFNRFFQGALEKVLKEASKN